MTSSIEDRLSISLADLKQRGFLRHSKSGSIDWMAGDELRASVRIAVKLDLDGPQPKGTLTLTYLRSDRPVTQVIEMAWRPSNLGRGDICYLVCPATGIRCRALLYGPGGFVSRHAEGGIKYRWQLYSHGQRASNAFHKELRVAERQMRAIEWMANPHCKRSYRGKLTRPMLRFRKLGALPV